MKKLSLFLMACVIGIANAASLAGIKLKDLDQKTVSLNDYQGKPLYIKAWASWCPICLATLPEIDDLSAEQNKNFNVITVVSPGHRGEKNMEKFIQWYKGLEYKNVVVLLDEEGEVIKQARVRGYPSSIIVDKDLTIQKTIAGHLSNEKIKQQF